MVADGVTPARPLVALIALACIFFAACTSSPDAGGSGGTSSGGASSDSGGAAATGGMPTDGGGGSGDDTGGTASGGLSSGGGNGVGGQGLGGEPGTGGTAVTGGAPGVGGSGGAESQSYGRCEEDQGTEQNPACADGEICVDNTCAETCPTDLNDAAVYECPASGGGSAPAQCSFVFGRCSLICETQGGPTYTCPDGMVCEYARCAWP